MSLSIGSKRLIAAVIPLSTVINGINQKYLGKKKASNYTAFKKSSFGNDLSCSSHKHFKFLFNKYVLSNYCIPLSLGFKENAKHVVPLLKEFVKLLNKDGNYLQSLSTKEMDHALSKALTTYVRIQG